MDAFYGTNTRLPDWAMATVAGQVQHDEVHLQLVPELALQSLSDRNLENLLERILAEKDERKIEDDPPPPYNKQDNPATAVLTEQERTPTGRLARLPRVLRDASDTRPQSTSSSIHVALSVPRQAFQRSVRNAITDRPPGYLTARTQSILDAHREPPGAPRPERIRQAYESSTASFRIDQVEQSPSLRASRFVDRFRRSIQRRGDNGTGHGAPQADGTPSPSSPESEESFGTQRSSSPEPVETPTPSSSSDDTRPPLSFLVRRDSVTARQTPTNTSLRPHWALGGLSVEELRASILDRQSHSTSLVSRASFLPPHDGPPEPAARPSTRSDLSVADRIRLYNYLDQQAQRRAGQPFSALRLRDTRPSGHE